MGEKNTSAADVIESFESSFADKQIIPDQLELVWLEKAIGRYSVELDPLNYDSDLMEFDSKLNRYTIDTLAQFMKQMYMERYWSMVNKRVSIVGKDLSIGASDNAKKYAEDELFYTKSQSINMIDNQKPTAYN